MHGAHQTIIVLGLSSGREITVTKVMLYPAKLVEQAANLRAQAMSKMGHTSTGIGFLGSPAWAVAGALLIGAVENSINNKNHQEGAALFQRASERFLEAKDRGKLIEVRDITGVQQPLPAAWKATFDYDETLNFSGLGQQEIDRLCHRHGIEEAKIYKSGLFSDFKLLRESIKIHRTDEFIFNGEDFVSVETEEGMIQIKWNDVSTYKISDGNEFYSSSLPCLNRQDI